MFTTKNKIKIFAVCCLSGLLFLVSCQSGRNPFGPPPASKAYLIVPGESAGPIAINENLDSVILSMGKPDYSNAAMGKVVAGWYVNKKDTTAGSIAVYSEREMGVGKEISRIKKIKITDTAYRMHIGLGIGDSLINIARVFVVRPIDTFSRNKIKYNVYGTTHGITFIINPKGICQEIIVHNPADISSKAYLPFQ